MVKQIRRIVAGNDSTGRAVALSDGPSPDVRLDPARPGFASTRLWVTDTTPARAKGLRETVNLPPSLDPPPRGSVCRVVEYPPEAGYIEKITTENVKSYFTSMGSPAAATARNGLPHPYMQRTASLDFCWVLEGEITLVLDTGEVDVKEGEAVIQLGTNHAWANRSGKPCILRINQHGGMLDGTPGQFPGADTPPSAAYKPLAGDYRRFRRLVTGQNAEGRSCVFSDGTMPNMFPRATGAVFSEAWTIDSMPIDLRANRDGGYPGRPLSHSPPPNGAHWRIAYTPTSHVLPESIKAKELAELQAMNRTGGTERMEGGRHWSMHRTPSVDYAVCLEGERFLVLEDSDVLIRKGDVVIQLGNWHSWDNRSGKPGMMSYVMIDGEYADGTRPKK